ncbi:avidin [Hoplias malabaricus]|uniref:avidin n=1 Tax=Hoplias malabaricus TaxID=27720 RepID=UPI0034622162
MKSSVMCVLCVLVLCAGSEPAPNKHLTHCNVTGHWRSDLGSMLMLTSGGLELRGVLHTSVETEQGASGQSREAKVFGVVGDGHQPTVAFSVLWGKGSCSAWVGQCFLLPGGGQVLKTLWMLRSTAESYLDNWESTRLGEDQFIFVGEGVDGR